eukprot:XP_014064959.1 PREDICTED: type II inositol 3,4-bisphosphate 4-phosphatase-like [Salmo salar]
MGEMEEGDMDHITADVQQAQKCTLVCESSQGTPNDKDNSPLTGAVFKNPVCKVYKFQTVDCKWMLVREQMEECTLSFSIPRQLLHLYIQEDMRSSLWPLPTTHLWSMAAQRLGHRAMCSTAKSATAPIYSKSLLSGILGMSLSH